MKKHILAIVLPAIALVFFFVMPSETSANHCFQHCLDQGNTPSECQALPSCSSGSADFGEIEPPPGVDRYGGFLSGGPTNLISNIAKVLIAIAGIYAFFNILLAGYVFISADGDPKKIQDAWSKIWQSILGLTVAAGAFVLAALIGQVLFGDPNALLQIRVFGP